MVIAFSPDGRRLAAVPMWVAEGDPIIRVWDLATGAVQTLDPDLHPGPFSNYLIFDDNQRLRWVGYANDPLQPIEIVERIFDLEDGSVTSFSSARLHYAEVPSVDGTFVLGIVYPELPSLRKDLVWVDLETGDRRRILTHGEYPGWLALDPSDQWIATGDAGVVRVGPVTGEDPHVFFGHRGVIRSVAISPDGRWIASGGEDGTIRVWPKPDLSKPPLHTLPHDELLAKLKSLTNLRIVEDPASAAGWRIDYAPFPGWTEVPEW
jgi:WD40 repeat protein